MGNSTRAIRIIPEGLNPFHAGSVPNRLVVGDRRTLPGVTLIDEVGLAPLAGDLARVEERLSNAVLAEDRFLGEVAGHLLSVGACRR